MRLRPCPIMLRILPIIFFFTFCASAFGQSYTIYKVDTINRIDADGLKQGYWIIFGKDKRRYMEHMKNRDYKSDQKIEEGTYKDGSQHGFWTMYWANEKVNSESNFVNGRRTGNYKTYYENGCLKEQGDWDGNYFTGHHRKYYDDSCGVISFEEEFVPSETPSYIDQKCDTIKY